MTLQELVHILENNTVTWKTVNTQPCIHTFIDCYSINLCLWNEENNLSVNVDNIKQGLMDIIDENIDKDNPHFEYLKNLYLSARHNSVNIIV